MGAALQKLAFPSAQEIVRPKETASEEAGALLLAQESMTDATRTTATVTDMAQLGVYVPAKLVE